MYPLVTHIQPGVADFARLKRASDVKLESRLQATRALGLFFVEFVQSGLGVEGVGLAWTALYEEHDAGFRFGRF